jgi:hypothetical protein
MLVAAPGEGDRLKKRLVGRLPVRRQALLVLASLAPCSSPSAGRERVRCRAASRKRPSPLRASSTRRRSSSPPTGGSRRREGWPDQGLPQRRLLRPLRRSFRQHPPDPNLGRRSAHWFFNAPDHEYPSYLELRLTATDAGALTDTKSVRLDPRTVEPDLPELAVGPAARGRELEQRHALHADGD